MKFAPTRMKAWRRFSKPSTRRGVTVVLIAFLTMIFIGTVALSVDVAYMQLTRAKLRASTDSAARAAGEAFSRLQSLDAARLAAKAMAEANEVAGKPLELANSDIVEGNTSFGYGGAWSFTPHGTPTNSIRV